MRPLPQFFNNLVIVSRIGIYDFTKVFGDIPTFSELKWEELLVAGEACWLSLS